MKGGNKYIMEMSKRPIEDMWKEYSELLLSTKRPGIKQLMEWLNNSDFKVAQQVLDIIMLSKVDY